MKRHWGFVWMIAFLGFPPGGALALLLIGRVETPVEALLGGAVAGAVIGAAQMLALSRRLPLTWRWVAATAAGLALGLGLSVALLGVETTLEATLARAPLTGLVLGTVQWWALRRVLPRAFWWIPASAVIFVISWFITAQVIGQSLNEGFVIFGASGALVYQALMGLLIWRLLAGETEFVQKAGKK